MEWQQSLAGVFVKCLGMPDMYDHERVARASCRPRARGAAAVRGVLRDATLGQAVFAVGPQVHALCWADGAQVVPADTAVKSFWSARRSGSLDRAASRYGARSVLYISFGSILFPRTTPELVAALIDTLLALEVPFPFAFELGGRLAALPAEVI
ncbi:hypothetical protein B0H15DRAFT_955860 [Mycena belliarum]|uniref:Uncharacterized protein n=1 Tax=Mycena belliarum TaxID=1033014 RepID=A0AAD6XK54_9AGAR|nr:hypothetical protein B0H15DRAFT_955860 [Mycena belliae]